MSRFPQRTVALEIFYAGWKYAGFATQGCVLQITGTARPVDHCAASSASDNLRAATVVNARVLRRCLAAPALT